MNNYLLVFDDGNGDEIDLKAFVDALDVDAKMVALDGHACFLKSILSVSQIGEHFSKYCGSRLYFISDITNADFSGRMPGAFWGEFIGSKAQAAAE